MAADCGVCHTQPSKYRCPTCSLRYCSLACYKPHKATHPDLPAAVGPSAPTVAAASGILPSTTRRPKKTKPDFTALATDPVLQDLLRREPRLRLQLQAIYGNTLEPSSASRRSQSSRGRGGFGGRGGEPPAPYLMGGWTQAKGDAEALERLKAMREADGEGGVAEFVRLVGLRCGDVVEQEGG